MTDTATLEQSAQNETRDAAATQPSRNRHGDFIWYELLTSDADAAAAFYGAVVGWKARDAAQPGMRYTLLSAPDGTDVAGLMTLPAEAAEHGMNAGWFGYVGVDDVDAAATKVKDAGGAIHKPPTDIPGVGRFAMLADPQGVMFYVMRGSVEGLSEAFKPMADGHCGWNELVTSDQAAALTFYIDQFGWTKGDVMPMGPMGDYQFIDHGGGMIGAVMTRPEGAPPPMWNFYFRVPSIAKAVETIGGKGGTITFGPQEVPGGDFVINAIDPQGAAFELVGQEK